MSVLLRSSRWNGRGGVGGVEMGKVEGGVEDVR